MQRLRRVLVVGAGLAGPAVARGLAALGIDVDLIEVRAESAEPGAGLLLTGNALLALDALGVGDAVRTAGRAVHAVRYADAEDRELFRLAIPRAWPAFVSIHRAALRRVLLEHPPALAVRFDTTLDRLETRSDFVRVRFAAGDEADYDLVIGADGVHSRLRAELFGGGAPAPIPGYAGWRCVAASAVEIAEPTYLLGNGRTLLLHPLRGGEIYCGAGPIDERAIPSAGDDLARLRAAFAGFTGPAARFLAALPSDLRLAPTRYWEIAQAPWHRGRSVLIGDAAHACAPTLAQGAALAFEDAVVLCELLSRSPDVESSLTHFEAQRRVRVESVQRASRARIDANRALAPHAHRVRDHVLRAVGARQLEAAWAPLMQERHERLEARR